MLDIGYTGAVVVFCAGLITSLVLVIYIVKSYYKCKDKDPYEDD